MSDVSSDENSNDYTSGLPYMTLQQYFDNFRHKLLMRVKKLCKDTENVSDVVNVINSALTHLLDEIDKNTVINSKPKDMEILEQVNTSKPSNSGVSVSSSDVATDALVSVVRNLKDIVSCLFEGQQSMGVSAEIPTMQCNTITKITSLLENVDVTSNENIARILKATRKYIQNSLDPENKPEHERIRAEIIESVLSLISSYMYLKKTNLNPDKDYIEYNCTQNKADPPKSIMKSYNQSSPNDNSDLRGFLSNTFDNLDVLEGHENGELLVALTSILLRSLQKYIDDSLFQKKKSHIKTFSFLAMKSIVTKIACEDSKLTENQALDMVVNVVQIIVNDIYAGTLSDQCKKRIACKASKDIARFLYLAFDKGLENYFFKTRTDTIQNDNIKPEVEEEKTDKGLGDNLAQFDTMKSLLGNITENLEKLNKLNFEWIDILRSNELERRKPEDKKEEIKTEVISLGCPEGLETEPDVNSSDYVGLKTNVLDCIEAIRNTLATEPNVGNLNLPRICRCENDPEVIAAKKALKTEFFGHCILQKDNNDLFKVTITERRDLDDISFLKNNDQMTDDEIFNRNYSIKSMSMPNQDVAGGDKHSIAGSTNGQLTETDVHILKKFQENMDTFYLQLHDEAKRCSEMIRNSTAACADELHSATKASVKLLHDEIGDIAQKLYDGHLISKNVLKELKLNENTNQNFLQNKLLSNSENSEIISEKEPNEDVEAENDIKHSLEYLYEDPNKSEEAVADNADISRKIENQKAKMNMVQRILKKLQNFGQCSKPDKPGDMVVPTSAENKTHNANLLDTDMKYDAATPNSVSATNNLNQNCAIDESSSDDAKTEIDKRSEILNNVKSRSNVNNADKPPRHYKTIRNVPKSKSQKHDINARISAAKNGTLVSKSRGQNNSKVKNYKPVKNVKNNLTDKRVKNVLNDDYIDEKFISYLPYKYRIQKSQNRNPKKTIAK